MTGASAGIGLAFAQDLAARGYDLVLTARRRERLEALARDAARCASAWTRTSLPRIWPTRMRPNAWSVSLAEQRLVIDLLVNNAGFGVPGRYAATSWAQQRDFLQVMVVAVSELTHRLLPGMLSRQWGRIINVASLAGLMPAVAGHTLYAASKAFVISFSESLALEVGAPGRACDRVMSRLHAHRVSRCHRHARAGEADARSSCGSTRRPGGARIVSMR